MHQKKNFYKIFFRKSHIKFKIANEKAKKFEYQDENCE